jgi:TPR repeat protein
VNIGDAMLSKSINIRLLSGIHGRQRLNAQLFLGRILLEGVNGIAAVDKIEAIKWFTRAAEAGVAGAQKILYGFQGEQRK